MNKGKHLIIADDFTGANDTGVQLKKNGFQTEVMLFPTGDTIDHAIVLDTESRTIPATAAFEKVATLTSKIMEQNQFDLVYKKVDSTIRGNIAEEIHAVADKYQPDLIVVAPALPTAGRTTVNGVQMLNGKPLMQTDIANDPLNPLWTDDIVKMLKKEFGSEVALAKTDTNDLSPRSSKVLVFDAITDEDLTVIAKFAQSLKKRILYVGSAGLAGALFQKSRIAKPSLAVVGSISETSLKQMAYAVDAGTAIITVQINDMLKPDRKALITKYQAMVRSKLKEGKNTVLTVTRRKEDYQKTIDAFKKMGTVDRSEISRIVRENLAAIASGIVKNESISGLFLTGGDTAIEMIRSLNASGSEIQSEIMPGVVLSKLVGGVASGLRIVTKAGAFGSEDTLFQSLKILNKEG